MWNIRNTIKITCGIYEIHCKLCCDDVPLKTVHCKVCCDDIELNTVNCKVLCDDVQLYTVKYDVMMFNCTL